MSNEFDLKICCIGAGYVGGPTMAVIAANCPKVRHRWRRFFASPSLSSMSFDPLHSSFIYLILLPTLIYLIFLPQLPQKKYRFVSVSLIYPKSKSTHGTPATFPSTSLVYARWSTNVWARISSSPSTLTTK